MMKSIKYLCICIILSAIIISSFIISNLMAKQKVNIYLLRANPAPLPLSQGLIQIIYPTTDFKGIPKKIQISTTPIFSRKFKKPFSCIWQGLLYVKESGLYKIGTNSDDGSWVYIDDKLVIDNGGKHASRLVETEIQISKGYHRLSIHYFDIGKEANLDISWGDEKIAPYTTLIPKALLLHCKSDYKKAYVDNLSKLNEILSPSLGDKIYITGFLLIKEEDRYNILIKSNERIGFRIGRKEFWFNPKSTTPITIDLRKKYHPFVIELENTSIRPGGPSLEFYWAKSGSPLEKIQSKYFSLKKI